MVSVGQAMPIDTPILLAETSTCLCSSLSRWLQGRLTFKLPIVRLPLLRRPLRKIVLEATEMVVDGVALLPRRWRLVHASAKGLFDGGAAGGVVAGGCPACWKTRTSISISSLEAIEL